MKKTITNIFAGIGVLAIIFMVSSFTRTNNNQQTDNYPNLGGTYDVSVDGSNFVKMFIQQTNRSNNKWRKVNIEGKTGLINLDNIAILK